MITTNDKMNETVKETLKMRGDNMSLYALKRIEELEEQVLSIGAVSESLLKKALDSAIKTADVCYLDENERKIATNEFMKGCRWFRNKLIAQLPVTK